MLKLEANAKTDIAVVLPYDGKEHSRTFLIWDWEVQCPPALPEFITRAQAHPEHDCLISVTIVEYVNSSVVSLWRHC